MDWIEARTFSDSYWKAYLAFLSSARAHGFSYYFVQEIGLYVRRRRQSERILNAPQELFRTLVPAFGVFNVLKVVLQNTVRIALFLS